MITNSRTYAALDHRATRQSFLRIQFGHTWLALACCFASLLTCLVVTTETASGEGKSTATVGMQAHIEQLVLPGSELESKPHEDRRTPIVIRITGAFAHGDSFSYDMTYYGLDPGEYNLVDYLQRKDGSSTGDLQEIKVTITSVLPTGQVEPNSLATQEADDLGGYRMQWIIGSVIWVAVLLLLLFGGRRKSATSSAGDARPKTLADRLRPTVEQAIAGDIEADKLAELERMLVAFWRRRLELESMTAAEAIVVLRKHEDAGMMLRQLEQWLHRPGGDESIDVAELLKPYRNLPPDALKPAPN